MSFDPTRAELMLGESNSLDKRQSRRRAIYLGEGLNVEIKNLSGNTYKGEVIEISQGGLAVAIYSSSPELVIGEVLSVNADVAKNQSFSLACILLSSTSAEYCGKSVWRLGLSYLSGPAKAENEERRDTKRFQVNSEFPPLAFSEDSLFFQEFLYFQFVEVSAQGAKLRCGLDQINLIPNLHLRLKVFVPNVGEISVPVAVRNLKVSSDLSATEVSVQVLDRLDEWQEMLGTYLFFHGQATAKELRRANFQYSDTYRAMRVVHPQSKKDWDEILELRLTAYKAVGKFGTAQDKSEMLDRFDQFSRQLMCRIGDNTIACSRIVFVGKDKNRSEHESLGVPLPEWLWTEGFVEVSRACAKPEYWGTDSFMVLLRHMARIVYQSGFRHMVANCNDNLWPLYRKVGFKKTGVVFDAFGTTGCSLITLDIVRVLNVRDASFLGFNLIPFKAAQFVMARQKEVPLRTRFLLWLHQKIHGLVKEFYKLSRKKRPRR